MIPFFDMSAIPVEPAKVWKKPGDYFMTAYERNVLVALAKSINAGVVIETGVQAGGAAREILTNVPSVHHYIGIDILPTSVPAMPQQALEVPPVAGAWVKHDPRFKLLISANGSHDFARDELPQCDLFLIDGDHSHMGVVHDTLLARWCVRPGGLILWHDYNEECVVDSKKVIDEMAASGDNIQRIENTWFAIERR
jgi:predicted O-methyltransferase YrrM